MQVIKYCILCLTFLFVGTVLIQAQSQNPPPQVCFLTEQGGKKFFLDDGKIFVDEVLMGTTKNGCLTSQELQCGTQKIEFFPSKLAKYKYSYAVVGDLCTQATVYIPKKVVNEYHKLLWAQPYINNILVKNQQLSDISQEITQKCPPWNNTCHIYSLYRYTSTNLSYIEDPQGVEKIYNPIETLLRGGGDCEDLTGVLNSLLSQLNIKNYVVLTEKHAYTLACNFDIDTLTKYVHHIFDNTQKLDTALEIKPHTVYYKSFATETSLVNFTFDITADTAIDFYTVSSEQEYKNFIEGKNFEYYQECSQKNTTEISYECQLPHNTSFIFFNNGNSSTRIFLNGSILYNTAHLNEIDLNYYTIGSTECLVLEATAGNNGYPGFTVEDDSSTIAVNPRNWEWFYLTQ